MNTPPDTGIPPAEPLPSATVRNIQRHHALWVKHFIKPMARFMRERGIAEVRIKIGPDGKVSYLLEPDAKWLGDSLQQG